MSGVPTALAKSKPWLSFKNLKKRKKKKGERKKKNSMQSQGTRCDNKMPEINKLVS